MHQSTASSQRPYIIATLLYAVVFIGMIWFHPGSETFYTAFHNTYQIFPPLLAGLCALAYAAKGQHRSTAYRIGWGLLGIGSILWAGGQLTWMIYESILKTEVPYPGPPDFGYLGAYPFLIVGVTFLFGAMPVAGRARHLLDSAIAASGVGVVSFYFLVQHLWKQDTSSAEKLLSVAYPLADVAALFSALVLFSAGSINRNLRRSVALLSLGIILIAFADTLFSYYQLLGKYATGSWFDWGWSFGWLCIAWAALLPLRWPIPVEQEPGPAPIPTSISTQTLWQAVSLPMLARVLIPYLSASFCFGVVALHDIQHGTPEELGHISNQVLFLGAWLIFLVALRQVLTLLENQLLNGKLVAFNSTLEQKVAQRTKQLKSLLDLGKAVNNTRDFDTVVNAAGRHALHVLQADAVILWSSGGDVPEMSLPPRVFPESVRHEYPSLLKFLAAQETVKETLSIPLEEIATQYPSLKAKVVRGVVAPHISASAPTGATEEDITEKSLAHMKGQCLIAPLFWQGKAIGMIAATSWNEPFEDDATAMLESVGVEVGTAMENARLYGAALKAADRDSVTGLLNHRAIHQRLDEEFQRAQHQDRPLSVIMMDLNNFKLFNDTYGHPIGDQVLKRVARALESECRKPGILARYGGDEFIAVLPDTDEPKAMVLAQRLSERMNREGFQGSSDSTTVPISLSFGVASYPEDCVNRFELVTIADRNLYQAKITDSGIMGTTETQRTHRALRTEGSFDVLDAMVTAVDNKDRYTRQHSEDVTEYALWIAEELGYSEGTQRVIRIGGLLHDVGKIGVPEDILRKPGKLSDEEYETMKRHTQLGALIVGGVSGMESIIDIVKSHHERWDGKGYPEGLAGEDIPLLGRLLAVADALSAMTTERPYRKGLPWETAVEEIRKGIGTQFDPEMAKAFLAVSAKGRPRSYHYKDQTQTESDAFSSELFYESPTALEPVESSSTLPPQRILDAQNDDDQGYSNPKRASLP